MTSKKLNELLGYLCPDALKMDGYDDCILGTCDQFGRPTVIAYDRTKVLRKLMRDGMTYEEAVEFWEFNQVGAGMGESTPVFIDVLSGGAKRAQTSKKILLKSK